MLHSEISLLVKDRRQLTKVNGGLECSGCLSTEGYAVPRWDFPFSGSVLLLPAQEHYTKHLRFNAMTPFNPYVAWATRLAETLRQGAPHIVRDSQDLALLWQTLETTEPLPESTVSLGLVLRQAGADLGVSCSWPDEFITLTCHAPLLRLTLRLLLEDLLHLQQTREPSFTWSYRVTEGRLAEFSLTTPLARQTLWRHYFLVGADFVTTAGPFVEYRRLWLGYLLHCLTQWNLIIDTNSLAPGTSQLVFQLGERSATRLPASVLLANYARTLQQSRQRLATFYHLRHLNPELTAYTCDLGAIPGPLNPKYIAIDGAGDGVGRTTTLLNLAFCFAKECNLKVLCLTTKGAKEEFVGGWKMPHWEYDQVPSNDPYDLLDFHRQIRPVGENLSILGYWEGHHKFWEQTLRSQCHQFDLVLMETHEMELEQDVSAWRLADLILFCGGLAYDEATYVASTVARPRELLTFEALPMVPFRTLLHQGENDLAQLREEYEQAGSPVLVSEIVGDKAYHKSLRSRRPVLEHSPHSRAAAAYRAAAEEILRLLYGL